MYKFYILHTTRNDKLTSWLNSEFQLYEPYGSFSLFQSERFGVISVLKNSIEYSLVFFNFLKNQIKHKFAALKFDIKSNSRQETNQPIQIQVFNRNHLSNAA